MAISLNAPSYQPLAITQGARYVLGMAWTHDETRVQLDDYIVRAQIRTDPREKLIADISSYFTIDEDLDEIVLDLPSSATWQIDRDGKWDLFLIHSEDPDDAVMLIRGPVTVIPATTRLR